MKENTMTNNTKYIIFAIVVSAVKYGAIAIYLYA